MAHAYRNLFFFLISHHLLWLMSSCCRPSQSDKAVFALRQAGIVELLARLYSGSLAESQSGHGSCWLLDGHTYVQRKLTLFSWYGLPKQTTTSSSSLATSHERSFSSRLLFSSMVFWYSKVARRAPTDFFPFLRQQELRDGQWSRSARHTRFGRSIGTRRSHFLRLRSYIIHNQRLVGADEFVYFQGQQIQGLWHLC